MPYTIARSLAGYQPLYCLPDALILLRGRTLYRSDLDLGRLERIGRLPDRKPIGRIPSRLIARIFRLQADAAALLDDGHLLIAQRSHIYRLSLATGTIETDLIVPNGARALYLSSIRDQATGERAICFGEYSTRFDGGPINIWKRGMEPTAQWGISGRFEAGEIDHVHNICQAADGRIFVLTGDFGQAAAIWETDGALRRLDPIARGSQDVRACWLWQAPDGRILFATDSQFETNHLRSLEGDGFGDVATILGSSIHAYGDRTRLIFSSTVEPGALSGGRLREIFDRRPGPGILANEAAIYTFENGALHELYRAAKDFWPMRLAQFGTFQLPAGEMPQDRFFAYGQAVKRHDGHCLLFKR